MAEINPGLSEELAKLGKIVEEQNTRIKTLEGDLKAKDNLIESLEQKIRQLENTQNDTKPADPNPDQDSDLNSDTNLDSDSETSDENADKHMKRENYHANQNPDSGSGFDVAVEAAVKAVRIPVILSKLLTKMQTRDLVRSRLVCREWRDSSTAILLRRKTFRVKFKSKFQNTSDGFTVSANSLGRDLKELTAFLVDSKTFPCAHFVFEGNAKPLDAQAFLSEFGRHFKGLGLIGSQDLNTIRKLFGLQVPKIESLELSEFVGVENPNPNPNPDPDPDFGSSLFPHPPSQRILSRLTCLKLGEGNSSALVKEILDAAQNLKECWGISSKEEIEWLCNRSRINVLKGLNLKLGLKTSSNWNQEALVHLNSTFKSLQNSLHLSCLKIACDAKDVADFGNLISEILCSGGTWLKEINVSAPLYFESTCGWPELEKVEKLTLAGDFTGYNYASVRRRRPFSQREISQVFPNLETICFSGFVNVDTFKHHFQIPTVKSLGLSTCGQIMMEVLLPSFLHLTHLNLDSVRNFDELSPVIWKVTGLKSLKLGIYYRSVLEVDVGFTGIRENMCKLLRTAERGKYSREEIETFRVKPSILNLTGLEELVLQCQIDIAARMYDTDFYQDGLTSEFVQICKYAFNLMPKLFVFYQHDH